MRRRFLKRKTPPSSRPNALWPIKRRVSRALSSATLSHANFSPARDTETSACPLSTAALVGPVMPGGLGSPSAFKACACHRIRDMTGKRIALRQASPGRCWRTAPRPEPPSFAHSFIHSFIHSKCCRRREPGRDAARRALRAEGRSPRGPGWVGARAKGSAPPLTLGWESGGPEKSGTSKHTGAVRGQGVGIQHLTAATHLAAQVPTAGGGGRAGAGCSPRESPAMGLVCL